MAKHFLIAGAGFSGAVLARQLAEAGHTCHIVEQRNHIAGNCYTSRDERTGVMVHRYGPHIFHTNDKAVWDFVNQHGVMMPYRNQVFATYQGRVFSLPINLHTINQFFGKNFSPSEAQAHIKSLTEAPTHGGVPKTFEEQGLAFTGRALYEAFLEGYTSKQWGVSPTALPASILKRLPLRFNYDNNYFFHPYQGMPRDGYTGIVESILAHPNIQVQLGERLSRDAKADADHIFFSGTLDGWFNYQAGCLAYRTLDFEPFYSEGDYQGCAVMNYSDKEIKHTRITEHKYFAPWEENKQSTICFREFARACEGDDVPYYPVRLVKDKAILSDYVRLAKEESKVSFLGRLGTYRYLDMDITIREAMDAAEGTLQALAAGNAPPSFFVSV